MVRCQMTFKESILPLQLLCMDRYEPESQYVQIKIYPSRTSAGGVPLRGIKDQVLMRPSYGPGGCGRSPDSRVGRTGRGVCTIVALQEKYTRPKCYRLRSRRRNSCLCAHHYTTLVLGPRSHTRLVVVS